MSSLLPTAWVAWLLQGIGELTLLLAICCSVDRYARLRWRPKVRNALWLVILVRLFLPQGFFPYSSAPVFEVSVPIALTSPPPIGIGVESVLLWIWSFGVAAVLVSWLLRAVFATARLEPACGSALALVTQLCRDLDLPSAPRIAVDCAAPTPYVTGLVCPRLVLPRQWLSWPRDMLVHAIAHELTHLRRRDLWLEALWMLASAAYWFHPLVHVARRQAYEAREMCCDADTARRFGDDYHRSMLQLVTSLAGLAPQFLRRDPLQHGWSPVVARLLALKRWQTAPTWRTRLATVCLTLGVTCVAVPGHLRFTMAPHPVDLAALVDPAERQRRGYGSLHLRYALQQAQASEQALPAHAGEE